MFNRYERLDKDRNTSGTGIGLALVKQLVHLAKGEINAYCSNKELVFEVVLPFKKESFEKHQIVSKTEQHTLPGIISEEVLIDSDDKPILLLVDDNTDIRSFIKESFNGDYKVLEAQNGRHGVEMAFEHIPDIILSDILMPEVTGIQLCEQLKSDERTSHIPIVLLTAKGDSETEIQGLKIGADDYIQKPFKLKLLTNRLNNLVNSRALLRERYSKEVVLKPTDIAINSGDQRFIERVKDILDTNISDDSFSSEDFSKALGMSRMQLHRKLKALTGLTTSEFLRTERLKVATVLLKDPSLNISEIGYQVGFSSPSYFSKCFKETYGMLPSEFRNSNV